MTECIRCKSSKTRKHGFGRHATQRYFCNGCHASFTLEGVRGTYRPEFKQAVIEAYCHQKLKAQTVVHDFWISTRTLIKWKKEHQQHCKCGN